MGKICVYRPYAGMYVLFGAGVHRAKGEAYEAVQARMSPYEGRKET